MTRKPLIADNDPAPVIIVGAGLAGLCCARRLHRAQVPYLVLEAADTVGGRVRTDPVDGFLLDRGFQVLLTSYPEARRVLDVDRLDLRHFESGAVVRVGSSFHRLSDPFRQPLRALSGLFSPVGTLADKLRVARLRRRVLRGPTSALFERPETTTLETLRARDFSAAMIDRFFRPFFGGVFLEDELETSSRWFELLFRLFSTGSASLPAKGMQAIPEQLAAGLDCGALRTGVRVSEIDEKWARCASGERIAASAVVVATDQPAARELGIEVDGVRFRSVTCLYYAAPEPPIRDPVLALNGNRGVINNLCVPSVLSRAYAPEGQELISVTVLSSAAERYGGPGEALETAVREELRDWFGALVESWRWLRSYQIESALPAQGPGEFQPRAGVDIRRGVYLCGDYVQTSSIQGAMVSGRKTAEAIIERLGRSAAT